MRKIALEIGVLLIMMAMVICAAYIGAGRRNTRSEKEIQASNAPQSGKQQAIQDHVDELVNCMVYFRDPRTGGCFVDVSACLAATAVVQGLSQPNEITWRANATLTDVNCGIIPPSLLMTARLKSVPVAVAASPRPNFPGQW